MDYPGSGLIPAAILIGPVMNCSSFLPDAWYEYRRNLQQRPEELEMTAKSAPIRISVVDDHPMVRRGLRMTLEDEPDFEVICEGSSADDACSIARNQNPDVLLLDVSMPGGGLEAAEQIARDRPDVKVAVFSVADDISTVRRALQAGVVAFITKGVEGDELIAAVRRVAKGERYVSPDLAVRLLQAGEDASRSSSQRMSLTKREEELLSLLGEGLSNAEIAERTGLAETTIKQYVSALIQKLGVRNRTAAALLSRDGTV